MATRPVCAATTLESLVVQVRENHDMTLIWYALGRPCLAPYTPWYFGVMDVPGEFAGDPEEAVKTHFAVPAADLDYVKDAAWFRYTDLQAAVDPLYGSKAGEVKAGIAEFESALQKEVRQFELSAGKLGADPGKDSGLLTEAVGGWTARTLAKLDELYAGIGVLTIGLPEEIDVDAPEEFHVRFRAEDAGKDKDFDAESLVLEKTLFGPHYASFAKRSKAGGARREGDDFCLSFTAGGWGENAAPCLTDMWLILEDEKGRRLVGKGLTTLTKKGQME
jgi:hypothetical protein